MLILAVLILLISPAAADTINGTINTVAGSAVTIQTCGGSVQVDASTALANQKSVQLSVGAQISVQGTMSGGTFNAAAISNHMVAACPPPPPANLPGGQVPPALR
jgi:hypothetical protein